MDGNRFDAFTKGLAAPQSRRRVLRALSGAGFGALFGLGGRDASANACKGAGKACKKDSQCCSGICSPPSDSTSTAGSSSTCCEPEATADTCAEKCDTQINNCGQTIDCGPCCTPNCDGKTCGDDGCGGNCGSCPSDENCYDGECRRYCSSEAFGYCEPGDICTRIGCLPDPCYGFICPEGQYCTPGPEYEYPVCNCPAGQAKCGEECVPGCCNDEMCDDGLDCTTNLCDYGRLGCVHIRIGGGSGDGGLCELGEFLPNDAECYGMSGICDSQYCDPDTGLCAPNPGGPCIKQGLPCVDDVPCCFGLPCTRGLCWDGNR